MADRLGERFLRPLAVDRLRALVRPSIEESRGGVLPKAFAALEAEAAQLAEEPTGAGLDVPDWLDILEDEVRRAADASPLDEAASDDLSSFPRVRLSWEQVQAQLSDWDETEKK